MTTLKYATDAKPTDLAVCLKKALEAQTGEQIEEIAFLEDQEVASTIEVADLVRAVVPDTGKAHIENFGDSHVITASNDEIARTISTSLENAGFLVDFAGDVVLCRRSPHRVRASRRAKRRFKPSRPSAKVAPAQPSNGPRPAGQRGDVPASTLMQLHVLNDEWSTKALRRIFKDHIGSDNYRYFLQFVSDVDQTARRYQKLCGAAKPDGADKAPDKAEASAEPEMAVFDDSKPVAVQIPMAFLEPDFNLNSINIQVGAD